MRASSIFRKFVFGPSTIKSISSIDYHFSSSAYIASSKVPSTSTSTTVGEKDKYYISLGLSLGQPTFESHKEFFTSNEEVIPMITRKEFRNRRNTLCHQAKEYIQKKTNSVVGLFSNPEFSHLIIIPAASKKYMSENIPYPFRQNSNFFYLTGSYDPDSFLVLSIMPNNEESHVLFIDDPDSLSDLWDGPKTSPKKATEHFGFDTAYFSSEFPSFLKQFSNNRIVVWCEDRQFVDKILTDKFSTEYRNLESPRRILDRMRNIKSPGEIELMQKSSSITSIAFQRSMKFCKERVDNLSEHQLWAKLDFECRDMGADRLAYPPVIASGDRANIIHYVFNSNKCNPDDMLLVDAGCEFFGYCSDVTRTWPVSGKFTNDRQRSLYDMLLDCQCELIKQVQPGISLDQLYRTMGAMLAKGMQDLGIIGDFGSKSIGYADVMLSFCPHHVSHYLGLDIHDTTTVNRSEALEEGMAITIEPGIYLRPSHQNILTKVGKEFIGIGIRIEDDLVVTNSGNIVLTSACPKSPSEIEFWANS